MCASMVRDSRNIYLGLGNGQIVLLDPESKKVEGVGKSRRGSDRQRGNL